MRVIWTLSEFIIQHKHHITLGMPRLLQVSRSMETYNFSDQLTMFSSTLFYATCLPASDVIVIRNWHHCTQDKHTSARQLQAGAKIVDADHFHCKLIGHTSGLSLPAIFATCSILTPPTVMNMMFSQWLCDFTSNYPLYSPNLCSVHFQCPNDACTWNHPSALSLPRIPWTVNQNKLLLVLGCYVR